MKYKMIPNPATTWKCTDRASIRRHHSSWARCSTITFIKDHPSYGNASSLQKIRRSLVCVVGPQCYVLSAGTRNFFRENDHCLSILVLSILTWVSSYNSWRRGSYYTHLKSEGQLGTMHNVSGEPWRQVAIKASRGKTKLHATNLGY
jgi:hypothetical protein